MPAEVVYHPDPGYNGIGPGGVVFVDGKTRASGMVLRFFRRRTDLGYRVGESTPLDPQPMVEEESVDLSPEETEAEELEDVVPSDALGMPPSNASRGTWADFAEAQGIDTEGLTKAKIIEAVKTALGA